MADRGFRELTEELDEVQTEINALRTQLQHNERALLRHIWEGNNQQADAAILIIQQIQDELDLATEMQTELIIQMVLLRG
ncbi:hypothetical protein BT93_G1653 [Corymbia citriodora subsp. variegata]|nr:hypothetical protein BT93_G1653 [Corymbia citriodora subsp. variegata]KAF8021285.1 hypothetical protein BT93_G1653 [Corymbia citriodora subsp. variegata]KAF8021286.1 hypothetical protein BT93_G1653 [Corymbia citriodora subsp. variegata]